jgi:arginyl-tRNA synthetase
MHVGHIRSIILGIVWRARCAAGQRVVTEDHIGDWGRGLETPVG